MDLLHLKYFQTVAQYESMTRASEKLHVAQPAISKIISGLERELNVSLFDRTGKFIRLNEYGRVFLDKVDQSLSILEDVRQELNDMTGNISGMVDIIAVCAMSLLPDLLGKFRQQYPNIRFHLAQHSVNTPLPTTFNVCITTSPQRVPNCESIPLMTEEIYLAVPSNHRLANRKSIRLIEAADEEFIVLGQGRACAR